MVYDAVCISYFSMGIIGTIEGIGNAVFYAETPIGNIIIQQ